MSEPTNYIDLLPQIDGPLVKHTESEFQAVSKSGDWLPRLQVIGSNSEIFKEGKIEIGVLALVTDNNNFKNLGPRTDILAISWRPKALDMSGPSPISFFNKDDEGFKATQKKAMMPNSSCMFGPEFLVWMPTQGVYATFMLGSKTARRESPNLLTLMKKSETDFGPAAATVSVKLIKGAKFSWHGPQIIACTAPLTPPDDPEEFAEQVNKFNNPPKSVVEIADQPAGGRAR